MKNLHVACGLLVTLLALGCSELKNSKMEAHVRGSEDFKSFLRLGAGTNRPALPRAGSSLNLTGDAEAVVSIEVDPASDVWSWVSFDTSRQSLIAPDQSLVEWSRNYIAQRKAELGLSAAELSSFSNTLFAPNSDQTYVTFQRQYQGREVKGAFIQLIFAQSPDGFRLREVLNNSYGPISIKTEAPLPISAQSVIDITGIPSLVVESQKLLIYPQLSAEGLYEFRYATEWVLADTKQEEDFHLILDDESQSILAANSSHYHVKQEITLETFKNSYVTRELVVAPLAGARVDQASTDANGVIDTAATQATITLASARGAVINLTGNQANTVPYSFPLTFAASGKTKVTGTAPIDAASVNAFAAVNEVVNWVSRFLTPQQLPLLTSGILTRVNLIGPQGSEYCNAFYNGNSLNFFAQGTLGNVTCANTALIKDVMYHEWGHALDDQVGIQPGITDSAFSEGIGDINATLATGDPIVGRGFFLNDATSMVRTVNNNRVHPPANAAEAQVHSAGQIIGGAFWDLRQNLVALYGAEEGTSRVGNFFFKHLLTTDRYIDSFATVIRLDDNDNNPATRSPSYCAINKAFGKHRLIGATALEGDACVDQDQGLKVRVDTDNGGGSLTLIASSFGATSVSFCAGKVTSCAGISGAVDFTKNAAGTPVAANSAKNFYESKGTVTVKAGEMYTLVSKDATGKTLGVKSLNFGTRDQTSDLSKTFKAQ